MTQAIREALKEVDSARGSHAGLLLNRFLRDDETGSRGNLLRVAVSASQAAHEVYEPAFRRWEGTVAEGAVRETVEIDGRMVIGLGSASPLETGLTLNHTYGTPLIPGSALKGLAAHYCRTVWGERDSGFKRDGQHYLTLFGSTEDSGHIIFHDAWVLPESLGESLALDVMTVHHVEYYREKDVPPTDFDDPTPIQFLSVRGKFAVALKCDVADEQGAAWAKLALQLLREAMLNWGIGGKTNSGYGRIQEVTTASPDASGRSVPGASQGTQRSLPNRASGPVAPVSGGPISAVVTPPCYAGEKVAAVLLPEKTKKGGWKAKYQWAGRSLSGPIHNTADVPAGEAPGDKVTLVVASVNNKEISFSWPK